MASDRAGSEQIRLVGAEWTNVVLVCRKCSKKLRGGFGPDADNRLGKVLKKALAERSPVRDGRKLKARRGSTGVLEVGCLDICPKGAVTVVLGSRPCEWLVVPRGTPAAEVLDRLGLRAGLGAH